jgi:hypothetical protein
VVRFIFLNILFLFNFLLLFFAPKSILGQGKTKNFYFQWGYNKERYGKSTIQFRSVASNYDFKIINALAIDKPDFNQIIKRPLEITIPQYSYRLGYFFKKNLGIEINFDHIKYVVKSQTARLQGTINNINYDKDTLVGSGEFLKFEHTNGGNILQLNYFKKLKLKSKLEKNKFSVLAKIGGGITIPKTDITFLGARLDNKFHVAGYCFAQETALRYGHKFFIELAPKFGFVHYVNSLASKDGIARHKFIYTEIIGSIGIQF